LIDDLNDFLPTVSIVIPTYNSHNILALCLKNIRNQDYPQDKIEIIIIDGGSKDNTLEIAKKYSVDKICYNPLVVEEFGRALGIDLASHDLIAFIDQDNLLVCSDWIKKMVAPFQDSEIVGSEPLFYSYRRTDPAIVRYCGLIGGDDPFHVYLGYYDRFCYFTNKWTDTPVIQTDTNDYLKIHLLCSKKIPTMGANGFIVRQNNLHKINYRPFIHTDIIFDLVNLGNSTFAKVRVGIIHLHANSILEFMRKKIRRAQRYNPKLRKYNNLSLKDPKLSLFVLRTLLLLTALDVAKGYRQKPDIAWLLHPFICFLALSTYATKTIMTIVHL
jgi:glycosyltransferase involved in cell wall biosynthesis